MQDLLCTGTDSDVLQNAFCLIPMVDFLSSPYSLTRGSLIIARVSAKNSIGWSASSTLSVQGVEVQTTPAQPANLIVDMSATYETQARVIMIAQTLVAQTGGSSIISYALEWDAGTAGSTYTPLVGDATNNLVLSYTQTSLTSGASYRFRYRTKNLFGWSDYSSVTVVLAAKAPDTPVAPVTLNVGTSVRIQWTMPYNGGSNFLTYSVQILHKDGSTLSSELTYCNARTDNTVIGNRYCVIPTTTLTAAPFLLVQGDIVRARVLAANIIGDSSYSAISSVGASIQRTPLQPALSPYRGTLTTTTQIEVLIAPLTGIFTGGATITSYLIEFDDASSGVNWYELQGFTTYTT